MQRQALAQLRPKNADLGMLKFRIWSMLRPLRMTVWPAVRQLESMLSQHPPRCGPVPHRSRIHRIGSSGPFAAFCANVLS